MRLVIDTNTAFSGLVWGGTQGRLIDAAEAGQVELASGVALLAELQGVLSREKFAKQLGKRGITVADIFDGYAALAAQADLITSSDAQLLDLQSFQNIEIVTANMAVERIGAAS